MQESQHDDVIPNGGQIVERFGGIRPMASKLNVPVTTVQGWKKRDAIPSIRRDEIINAANRYDVPVQDLVGAGANENAPFETARGNVTSIGIAEDPALTRASAQIAPAPEEILVGTPLNQRPQPKVQAQPQPAKAAPVTQQQPAPKRDTVETFTGVDMSQVRKSARRTSMITSACLIVLAAGGAYLLFGQSNDRAQPAAQIQALDGRVTALEQQKGATGDGSAFKSLQDQVSNITAVIGTSADGLTQMAREVAAGTNAPLTQRLAVLEAQLKSSMGGAGSPALSSLTNRMEAMSASPQGQAEWQAAIADLRNTVTGLSGKTDQLDGALAEARTQNDALGRTLSQVSGNDLSAAAMLLALTQLRNAVDRQAPFEQDLAMLKTMSAGADPELGASLDKLSPYAQSGIMSPTALKGALQASANDIITAKMRGENVSVKEKIMLHLKSLFSIHKDGDASGEGTEHDLIKTASSQLDAGDVAGAMATLQQLQGPAAQAAQPWQQQAQATLVAQTVDGDLVKSIISKVKNGLSSVAGGASSMTGVVNSGPINMTPGAAPSLPMIPGVSDPAVQPTPEAGNAPRVMQPIAPQTMAPMEQQSVPGVVIAPAQPQAAAPQAVPATPALPQTEPQAGEAGPVLNAPTLTPAPSDSVTIQQ